MAKKSTKRSKKPDETKIKTIEPTTPIEAPGVPEAVATDEAPVTVAGDPVVDSQPVSSGLTSFADYYQEPVAAPVPERVLTQQQLASIRNDAFEEQFGAPVVDYRSAVMARLNDKLRS